MKKNLKRIVIAFLIIVVFGVFFTKCNNCGKSKSSELIEETKSAAKSTVDYSVMPFTFVRTLDFNNDISTYPYYSIKNDNISLPNPSFILLTNLPNSQITIECVSNSSEDLFFSLLDPSTGSMPVFYKYFTFTPSSSLTYEIGIRTNLDSLTYSLNIYFYAGEYVPGYGQGLAAGLQQGRAEGAEQAKYGIFQNARVSATFNYASESNNNPSTELGSNLIPDYISNGINTTSLYNKHSNKTGYYLNSVDMTIKLVEPFAYGNDSPILIGGPSVSLIDNIILTDVDNKKYTVNIVYNSYGLNYSEASEDDVKKMGLIKSIFIHFGNAEDTFQNVSIVQDNGNYVGGFTAGYNDGYNDGKLEGDSIGYESGYKKGFSEGESQGYANAVSEGVSQMGIFSAAISFIKVFFQLTTQFFETKIVGDMTLGLFVIGLPAAFMIVNLALGLVKKFLGGRGASEGNSDE